MPAVSQMSSAPSQSNLQSRNTSAYATALHSTEKAGGGLLAYKDVELFAVQDIVPEDVSVWHYVFDAAPGHAWEGLEDS